MRREHRRLAGAQLGIAGSAERRYPFHAASAGLGPGLLGGLTAAGTAHGDVPIALDLARQISDVVPRPGSGRTLERWELLATIGAVDLTVARVIEPDLDARAILAEAAEPADAADRSAVNRSSGDAPPLVGAEQVWGVFASEGPAATVTATATGDGFRLDGVKPWCSLAGSLTHALITAPGPGGRQLFAVDLRHPGVEVLPVAWVSRGLADVSSGPIELSSVPAVAVGEPEWYVDRPGFWWGGIGVAACWYGGAVGLARTAWAQVHRQAQGRRSDIALAQLGAVDIALHAARAALEESAGLIDDPSTPPEVFPRLAQRVRAVVAGAAENVLRDSGHLIGPAPLAFDEEHARRVADLTVYVRQQHAERDAAGLARMLADDPQCPY